MTDPATIEGTARAFLARSGADPDTWETIAATVRGVIEAMPAAVPTIHVEDITTITNRLIERSDKFRAFFNRAELEEHVVFAMAPTYQAMPGPSELRRLAFADLSEHELFDTLGIVVREAWVKWANSLENPKPSWLVPFEELSPSDQEADRQIGIAVSRWIMDRLDRAAPPPPSAGDGWRPIESAPKDGTFILCVLSSGMILILQFCSEGYWRKATASAARFHPTHWRPLPPPPEGGR